MGQNNKYLIMYLGLAFGIWWGISGLYIFFPGILTPITGKLTLTHPITIFCLYVPSLAGLVAYFAYGGRKAVINLFLKLVPRKKDLIWFPVLFIVSCIFWISVHYGSESFGIPVPKVDYSFPKMLSVAAITFIKEAGLIGGLFGWIGFLLPFLQSKFKNNILSALLTGFIFGLWVLPGYIIASIGVTTFYWLYVLQLMFFILFQSYIFNVTKGSLVFYLFSFWLVALGSHLQFYYFIPGVQVLQIGFFILMSILIHVVLKKIGTKQPLQAFPHFINRRPTKSEMAGSDRSEWNASY